MKRLRSCAKKEQEILDKTVLHSPYPAIAEVYTFSTEKLEHSFDFQTIHTARTDRLQYSALSTCSHLALGRSIPNPNFFKLSNVARRVLITQSQRPYCLLHRFNFIFSLLSTWGRFPGHLSWAVVFQAIHTDTSEEPRMNDGRQWDECNSAKVYISGYKHAFIHNRNSNIPTESCSRRWA